MPSGGKPCPSGSQYSKQEKEPCEAGKDLVKVVWFAEAVERLHQNSPRMGFSLGGSSWRSGIAPQSLQLLIVLRRSALFRIQMLFDKFSHGFVGFSNFLRIPAFKQMFSVFDWDQGGGNALFLELLRHQL